MDGGNGGQSQGRRGKRLNSSYGDLVAFARKGAPIASRGDLTASLIRFRDTDTGDAITSEIAPSRNCRKLPVRLSAS
jgi:hypothetical protein